MSGKYYSSWPQQVLQNSVCVRWLIDDTNIGPRIQLNSSSGKVRSILNPLVKSALPEDILRAWNRSHFQTKRGEKPLSKLLDFVRFEVESQEKFFSS